MNELANIDEMSNADIMDAIGQSKGTNLPILPKLTINRDATDEEGNQLPVGVFKTYDTVSEQDVFGKPVKIRPFINNFQWMKYDENKQEYSNRSVIFPTLDSPQEDILGTEKCGRVPRKEWDNLTPDKLVEQKKIRCYRLVYGLLTMDGKTAGKESVKLENYPVLYRVSGSNFSPIGTAIESLGRRNKIMFRHNIILETDRRKTGSNVFYVAKTKIDDTQIDFSDKDRETMDVFKAIIEKENASVLELYDAVVKSKTSPQDMADAKVIKEVTAA